MEAADKLCGNCDLAAGHDEGILAVALIGQLELIAAGVLDGKLVQLVALIRGHGDGHAVALGSVLGADGHIAVLGAGCGHCIAGITIPMATGAAGGRTGQLCNRLRFNSGFLCTSRILKDLLANRAGVVFIIAGFCISRSLGFGLGQTMGSKTAIGLTAYCANGLMHVMFWLIQSIHE